MRSQNSKSDAGAGDDVRGRFVERFESAWAESDANRLMPLLRDDVRLRQPMLPPIDGKPAALASLTDFIAGAPGVRAEVTSWLPTATGVFIECDMVVPGRREVRWRLIDRFDLDRDVATFRISYWDLHEISAALLRRPDVMARCWSAGARVRGARVAGPGATDMPPPISARDTDREILEFTRPARLLRGAVRACLNRELRGGRPSRVYVADPFVAALLSTPNAPDFEPNAFAELEAA